MQALFDLLSFLVCLRGSRDGCSARSARRPRVYFEEWDEPQLSVIRWVSELIDIAGGSDIFAASRRRSNRSAADSVRRTADITYLSRPLLRLLWASRPMHMHDHVDAPLCELGFDVTAQEPLRFLLLPQRCIHVAQREPTGK